MYISQNKFLISHLHVSEYPNNLPLFSNNAQSSYYKVAKIWKFQVALNNAKIQPIFDPLTFHIFLTIYIIDALLYLKYLPL